MSLITTSIELALLIVSCSARCPSQAETPPVKSPATASPSSAQKTEELRKQAELARDGGMPSEALRLYQQLVDLQPAWSEGWWYVGSINYHLKQYAPAAEAYEQFVKCEPDNGKGWGMLGVCEALLKKTALALSHLEKAVATNLGGDPAVIRLVRFHYAVMLTRIKEFQYAFFFLYALVLENQTSDEVLDAMGMTILHRSNALDSLPLAERNMIREYGRVLYLSSVGKIEEAEQMASKLESHYRGNPGVAFAHGLILQLQLKYELAQKYFQQELEINPFDIDVYLQLSSGALSSGSTETGLQYARQACEIAPGNGMALYYLGRFQMRLNEWGQAQKSLEKAAQLAPQAFEVPYALAQVYLQLNQAEAAKRAQAQYERLQLNYKRRMGRIPLEGK
jgi:tetratricopeptide (TPR) repeat protein